MTKSFIDKIMRLPEIVALALGNDFIKVSFFHHSTVPPFQ